MSSLKMFCEKRNLKDPIPAKNISDVVVVCEANVDLKAIIR